MKYLFAIAFFCSTVSNAFAQYEVITLCDVQAVLTDSLPKGLVKLTVPHDVVRLIYTVSYEQRDKDDTATLASKVNVLLPDHLDKLLIADIPNRLRFKEKPVSKLNLFHFNSLRHVRLFSKRSRKCKPRYKQENCLPGVYDIDWQATLFKENYYLYMEKSVAGPAYIRIEAVAITAD